jgi:hypothetical protein
VPTTRGVTAGRGDMPWSPRPRHLMETSRSRTALISGVKSWGMVERSEGDSSDAKAVASDPFSGVLNNDTRLCNN